MRPHWWNYNQGNILERPPGQRKTTTFFRYLVTNRFPRSFLWVCANRRAPLRGPGPEAFASVGLAIMRPWNAIIVNFICHYCNVLIHIMYIHHVFCSCHFFILCTCLFLFFSRSVLYNLSDADLLRYYDSLIGSSINRSLRHTTRKLAATALFSNKFSWT